MAGVTAKRNVLVLAVVLGVVAAGLTYKYVKNVRAAHEEAWVNVVQTRIGLEPRTIIGSEMVVLQRVRISEAPSGYLTRKEDVVDKVLLNKLGANSIITAEDVAAKDSSLGLSYVIPPGMRAVTVAVDPVIGVAGFLKPGDHVDVLATFNRYDIQQPVAKTVLQDVKLLALGSQTQKDNIRKGEGKPTSTEGRNTATLCVTPQDAAKLVLAENEGRLRLVLRAYGDISRIPVKEISSSQVTGARTIRITREAPPPPYRQTPPPGIWQERPAPRYPAPVITSPKPKRTIIVISGTDVQKVEIE